MDRARDPTETPHRRHKRVARCLARLDVSSPLFNAHAFLDGLAEHFGRLLATPWLRIEVEYLPTHVPTPAEAASGQTLAEAVRVEMGAASGLPLHTLGARELRKEMKAAAEVAKAKAAAKAAAKEGATPLV